MKNHRNDKKISETLATNKKTAINEVFTNVSNGKSSIANAISNISISSLGGYRVAAGTTKVDSSSGYNDNILYISTINFPFDEVKFFACLGTARISSSQTKYTSIIVHGSYIVLS